MNLLSNKKKLAYNELVKGGDVRPFPLSKLIATGEVTSAYDHGAPNTSVGGTMRSRRSADLVDNK